MTALLALGSSLLWGIADFLGGTATRRLPAYLVIGWSQALALVVLVPLAVLTGAYADPLGYLPWAVAAGLVGLVALGAFYSALASGTMGVVAPIAATSVVVPVTVGLARGDRPSALQVAGIAAAGLGVVLASGAGGVGGRNRASVRPVVLSLVAAAGFGAVIVFLALGARSSVLMTLVTMRVVTVTVVAAGAVALGTRSARGSRSGGRSHRLRESSGLGSARRELPLLAAVGFGDGAANAAYAAATTRGALSIVAVLGSLYPAVTVLLARQVHGERLRPIQSAGVTVALAGVVLIASGGGTG